MSKVCRNDNLSLSRTFIYKIMYYYLLGGLDDVVENLITNARERNVPIIFTGNRFILGKPIFIKSPISAIGILNYQGTEVRITEL